MPQVLCALRNFLFIFWLVSLLLSEPVEHFCKSQRGLCNFNSLIYILGQSRHKITIKKIKKTNHLLPYDYELCFRWPVVDKIEQWAPDFVYLVVFQEML